MKWNKLSLKKKKKYAAHFQLPAEAISKVL